MEMSINKYFKKPSVVLCVPSVVLCVIITRSYTEAHRVYEMKTTYYE